MVGKINRIEIKDYFIMGDRGNIFVRDSGVCLYSHWGGSDLGAVLRRALVRGARRWDDPSYLARIIFAEMTKGEEMELTGYGISDSVYDNEHPVIVVDTDNKMVGLCDEDNVTTMDTIPKDDQQVIRDAFLEGKDQQALKMMYSARNKLPPKMSKPLSFEAFCKLSDKQAKDWHLGEDEDQYEGSWREAADNEGARLAHESDE